jgi:Cof subfamily protein (haloacid dehalogenase superfamily)
LKNIQVFLNLQDSGIKKVCDRDDQTGADMMDKKDIRLIALDLDGTTFNSDKIITERTRQTILAAINQGVIVMPSTGRHKKGLPESFISIPGVRYALTSNGGAVVDLKEDRIVHGDFMDNEKACCCVDTFLGMDALVEVYHDGNTYADRAGYEKVLYTYKNLPDWFRKYVAQTRTPVEDLRERVYSGQLKIEKFLVTFNDSRIRKKAFEMAESIGDISICYGTDFNMEISSPTATKGNSLLAFAKKLGVRQEQIMACGDNGNDRTMLEVAGWAVAMANAEPEIKALADYVTLSNDEDGVAYAIEKFVLT